MKKIDFVKKGFTDSDGRQSESYWDLLDEAVGGKEADDKDAEIIDAFIAAVIPASLKGVEYPKLPDEIHEIVSKFGDLVADFGSLAKRTGFNAGFEAGLAQGVLLGLYGNDQDSKIANAATKPN